MRLLVHLHIFNQDQVPFFLDRLANINGCQWDLAVTCSALDGQVKEAIKTFRPDTLFFELENFGYDIWPFIYVIKRIDILSYDLVLKLHTKSPSIKKQRFNGISFNGYQWRDLMVNALMGSPAVFRKNLNRFEKDKKLGFLCGAEVYKSLSEGSPEDLEMLEEECIRLGICSADKHFCAGTVFMARMAPYSVLKSGKVSAEMFRNQNVSHSFGTMSHVYERILAMVVTSAGFETGVVFRFDRKCVTARVHRAVSPVLRKIFAIERFGSDRVKCLVFLGAKIPLEKASQKRR